MSKIASKIGVAAIALVTIVGVSGITPASAATADELQAQITALLAQISALQSQLGGSTTGGTTYNFTRDLTLGSTGDDVKALQQFLNSKGFTVAASGAGSVGNESTYFGTLTQSALAKFQAANGISPAAGYFGAITRAKIASVGGGTTGGTTGGGTVTGLAGSGRLRNIDSTGDVESSLDEGDGLTSVLGVSMDAEGGDVQLQRVDVTITIQGNGSSNITKYIDTVALYLGSTRLATMDASDGDKSGKEWSYRFANLTPVIKNGATGTLYVKVTPINSIGAAEAGDDVDVEIPADGIRATAADGISETYGAGYLETFSVDVAAAGGVTISEGDDNPDDATVDTDDNATTEDVTILEVNVKAKNQDITINNFPIRITTGTVVDPGKVVQTVKLMNGSKTLKSQSVSDTANGSAAGDKIALVVFNNINQDISKGDTETYSVVATLKKSNDAATYNDGETIVADTDVLAPLDAKWDIEDSNGDAVNPTGSSLGGTLTLSAEGFNVTATSTDVKGSGTSDDPAGTYTIKFRVEAGDEAVYIAPSAIDAGNAGADANGALYNAITAGAALATANYAANFVTADPVLTSTASMSGGTYKVNAGSSATFTLTLTLEPKTANGGSYSVELVGVNYADSAANALAGTVTTYNISTDNSNFETDPYFIAGGAH